MLHFHMEGPPPKLPSRDSFQREVEAASLISEGDPTRIFRDMSDLGEGASGKVYLARDSRSGEKVRLQQSAFE